TSGLRMGAGAWGYSSGRTGSGVVIGIASGRMITPAAPNLSLISRSFPFYLVYFGRVVADAQQQTMEGRGDSRTRPETAAWHAGAVNNCRPAAINLGYTDRDSGRATTPHRGEINHAQRRRSLGPTLPPGVPGGCARGRRTQCRSARGPH